MRAFRHAFLARHGQPLRLVLAVLCLLGASVDAIANVCRSIEAELATMARGPSVRERQMAGRAAHDAQRLWGHMRSIGCDRQQVLFFGQAPPAECGGYRAQLAQLQAQSRAAYAPDEGRRRQLMSMLISYNCRTSPQAPIEAARSLPLTAGTLDDGSRRRGEISTDDLDRPRVEHRIRSVPGKAVCVRLCDGFYFPLDQRGARLKDEGDNICQALCPAAETKIYFLAGGIENARSSSGESYSDLDTALRYRKTFDASCFCRRPGEPWGAAQATVLNPENPDGGPGFDVLGGQEREEEVFPLRGMTPVPGKKRNTRLFDKPPPEKPALPADPVILQERFVGAGEGERFEIRTPDGATRTVRVVAPELSRVPEGARAPSVPDPSSSQ
jgi:hypothetical protein